MKRELYDRFASKLDSAQDAPEPLDSAMLAALKPDDEVRLLIFGPAYKAVRKTMPATLLAILAHEWIVVTGPEEHLAQVYRCEFADILLVEVTHILLHGMLKIDFVIEGRAETVAISFNTVMEGLYQEATQMLLNGIDQISEITPYGSKEQYPVLEPLPLKFYNAIVEFIPMGQRVLGFVHWQPVFGRKLKMFRHELTPEAVLVLTDRELLFVSEEKTWSWVQTERVEKYGCIATHCPLSRVSTFQLNEHDTLDTIDITVQTPKGGEKLKIEFPGEQKPELTSFMEKVLEHFK
ncbi:MAG: hypothetical protein ACREE6_11735 [Limisphaerales bacterium]